MMRVHMALGWPYSNWLGGARALVILSWQIAETAASTILCFFAMEKAPKGSPSAKAFSQRARSGKPQAGRAATGAKAAQARSSNQHKNKRKGERGRGAGGARGPAAAGLVASSLSDADARIQAAKDAAAEIVDQAAAIAADEVVAQIKEKTAEITVIPAEGRVMYARVENRATVSFGTQTVEEGGELDLVHVTSQAYDVVKMVDGAEVRDDKHRECDTQCDTRPYTVFEPTPVPGEKYDRTDFGKGRRGNLFRVISYSNQGKNDYFEWAYLAGPTQIAWITLIAGLLMAVHIYGFSPWLAEAIAALCTVVGGWFSAIVLAAVASMCASIWLMPARSLRCTGREINVGGQSDVRPMQYQLQYKITNPRVVEYEVSSRGFHKFGFVSHDLLTALSTRFAGAEWNVAAARSYAQSLLAHINIDRDIAASVIHMTLLLAPLIIAGEHEAESWLEMLFKRLAAWLGPDRVLSHF